MDEEKFRIKTYGFGELAQLYLPDATPMSASNRLRIWITRNKTLMDKLHNLGYVKKTRLLTPEMVKEIVANIKTDDLENMFRMQSRLPILVLAPA